MPTKNKKTQKNTLRIIGGQWRGRKLSIADAEGLRPTGDRIRETLFNWLAPQLHDSRCLDLFAGTGALGLEALSRGARQVTFVEQNRELARSLAINLNTLSCDRATVSNSDALSWLEHPDTGPFDIVFVDPPFSRNLWKQALIQLSKSKLLGSEALIYVESPRDQVIDIPLGWQNHRHKQAGAINYGLWKACEILTRQAPDTGRPTSDPENV